MLNDGLPVFPLLERDQIVSADDQNMSIVRSEFLQLEQRVDRIGWFWQRKLDGIDLDQRIVGCRQLSHGLAIGLRCELIGVLEWIVRGHNQFYFIKICLSRHELSDHKMPNVDRVERAEEISDFLCWS